MPSTCSDAVLAGSSIVAGRSSTLIYTSSVVFVSGPTSISEFNLLTKMVRLLTKMVRERLYDAASLILTPQNAGRTGAFSEPCPELTFANFAESLVARAIAYSRTRR